MNNKGFAITTVLYGTLILFCLLLISMLGILSTYKNNLDKLINGVNGENGTRSKVTIKKPTECIESNEEVNRLGFYCMEISDSESVETVYKYCSSKNCFDVD